MRVESLQNGILVEYNLEDLFVGRRILLCSVCRIADYLTEQYLHYLKAAESQYQSLGVDAIVVITSSHGRFGLAWIDKINVGLLTLYDSDHSCVEYLARIYNKSLPTFHLSKYWSYQVLINDGNIEKFYEQPTENQLKHLINAHVNDVKFLSDNKRYLKGSEDAFNMTLLPIGPMQKYDVGGRIFYYNLWPNKKLQEYLLEG